MKVVIPQQVPFTVLKEIGINFIKQKIGSETVQRKSAFKLQDKLLNYIITEGREIISDFSDIKLDTNNLHIERKIWLLWWQGLPVTNRIAAACIEHVLKLKNFEVNLITQNNVSEYIYIDDIMPLFNMGNLYIQHLSDIIRIRLLKKYGGFWLDSSIALIDSEYLSDIANNFSFISNKFYNYDSVQNISDGKYSTYFWGTFRNNPFFDFVDKMMTSFILNHKGIVDYTQFDYSVMAGYKKIGFIRELIDSIPYNNQNSWWLNDRIFDKFDPSLWKEITKETHFFKISAKKYNGCKVNSSNEVKTYWDYIVNFLWK